MDDDLRSKGLRRRVERLRILQHEDHRGEAILALQHRVPGLLERDIVIGRQAIHAQNLMALLQKAGGQMKPDKAGGSGDQQSHDVGPDHPNVAAVSPNADDLTMGGGGF